MKHTALLTVILEKADAIKEEFHCPHLYASHIAAAVADFCAVKYTGFSLSDMTYLPSRFEEERLRYVFSKEVRLSSYFRMRLARNTKYGEEEELFDLSCCESIASARGAEQLSSDTVFLCALTRLHESYRPVVRNVCTDESILALLQDTDTNIYDYVIRKIEELRAALKKKADEAAAIRDWKPAPKFAQPDELTAMFLAKIEQRTDGNVLTLKIPHFFGSTDLKLSIYQVGGIYYLHDNGCALRHLAKQVKDKEKCERIRKKVCHSSWLEQNKITGSFCSTFSFFHYLKMLVFVAQADLYYTKVSWQLYRKEKGHVYPGTEKAEPMDNAALVEQLKEGIGFSYDEDLGLYCWSDVSSPLSSRRMSFLMETREGGYVRISDLRKGADEGEIFEAFYWDHDDITPYSKCISDLAARFGAQFDGRDVYLADKTGNFDKALLRFFNLAVLISALGYDIPIPKVKRKR